MTDALQNAERENKRLQDIVCHMATAWVQVFDAFLEDMDSDSEENDQPWPYRVAHDMASAINTKYNLQDLHKDWRALTDDETTLFIEGRLTSDEFSPEHKAKIVEHFMR